MRLWRASSGATSTDRSQRAEPDTHTAQLSAEKLFFGGGDAVQQDSGVKGYASAAARGRCVEIGCLDVGRSPAVYFGRHTLNPTAVYSILVYLYLIF